MIYSEALYNLNPLTRFTDKVENYAKYRPSYPEAVIDKILEGLASPSQLVAADIGAGTGISARQLAERGVNVIAIEPNAAMRDAGRNVISKDATSKDQISKDATSKDQISKDATSKDQISKDATSKDQISKDATSKDQISKDATSKDQISKDATCRVSTKSKYLVEWRDGTAEITNLPNASVDLITCFQAFHWFKPELTLLEFRRILKSSGRLAVIFNDLNRDDKFTKKYHELILSTANKRLATDFSAKVQPLRENPQWRYLQCQTFTYEQKLDLAKLIGLAKSVSFISSEERVQTQLVSDLEDLYHKFANEDGFVSLGYRTSVHIAELKLMH